MSAADRIRERNDEIATYMEAVSDAAATFYDAHQEELEALYDAPDGLDLHWVQEGDETYEEMVGLAETFNRYMQDAVGGNLPAEKRTDNLRRIIYELREDTDTEPLTGAPFESERLERLETENYRDYMQLLGEAVDADDDMDAAYVLSGNDAMPAAVIGGHWTYVGLHFDEGRETAVNGTPVTHLPQNVHEGLPQIPDDSLDLALVKTPGSGFEPTEQFYELISRKMDPEGWLAADREPLGDTFTADQKLTPVPTTVTQRVTDPFGGGGYNVLPLTLYRPET